MNRSRSSRFRRPSVLAAVLAGSLLVLAAGARGEGLADRDAELAALAARVAPSVLKVHAERPWPWGGTRRSTVSGVVVDDRGTIVTLGSAVLGATSVELELGDGSRRKAKVLGVDVHANVGVLAAEAADGLVPVAAAPPDSVRPGHFAMAIGNPFGLTDSVGTGIVSGLGREVEGTAIVDGRTEKVRYYDLIQTTVPINPGDAGGVLVDCHGRMIGMISSTFGRAPSVEQLRALFREFLQTIDLDQVRVWLDALNLTDEQKALARLVVGSLREMQQKSADAPAAFEGTPGTDLWASYGAQGINFVLPVDQVLHAASMIRRFGHAVRLGIRVEVPDPTLVAQLGLEKGQGLVIQNVLPESAAARAGIEKYDILLSVGGRAVGELHDIRRALVAAPVDEPLDVELLHRGARVTRQVRFGP